MLFAVPDIRIAYRHETLQQELQMVLQAAREEYEARKASETASSAASS